MVAYLERFEELLNDVDGQSETSLVSFFIGGMKPDLKCKLNIIQPTSLHTAFSLAKVYEAQWGLGKYRGHSLVPKPLLKTPSTGEKGVPIIRKMLTVEERKERLGKGLCFNYDESYAPEHKCKGCLFRMDADQQCFVELMDQQDDSGDDEITEASVATTEINM